MQYRCQLPFRLIIECICYKGYAKYIRSICSHRKVKVQMQYSAVRIRIWKRSGFSRRYCALCCVSDWFYIYNYMHAAAGNRTVWFWKNEMIRSNSWESEFVKWHHGTLSALWLRLTDVEQLISSGLQVTCRYSVSTRTRRLSFLVLAETCCWDRFRASCR